MRKHTLPDISEIIIHCAATKPDMDIGAKDIREWHLDRGWDDIGYHFVIRRNGGIEAGRKITHCGAHARSANFGSFGICLAGGLDARGQPSLNYTFDQLVSCFFLVSSLIEMVRPYRRSSAPPIDVLGHCQVPGTNKWCPGFRVSDWWTAACDARQAGDGIPSFKAFATEA